MSAKYPISAFFQCLDPEEEEEEEEEDADLDARQLQPHHLQPDSGATATVVQPLNRLRQRLIGDDAEDQEAEDDAQDADDDHSDHKQDSSAAGPLPWLPAPKHKRRKIVTSKDVVPEATTADNLGPATQDYGDFGRKGELADDTFGQDTRREHHKEKEEVKPAPNLLGTSYDLSSDEEDMTDVKKSLLGKAINDSTAMEEITVVSAKDLRDNQWEYKSSADIWTPARSHFEPGRLQKQKHQITWLATSAQEDEKRIAELGARARDAKRSTRMKYGW